MSAAPIKITNCYEEYDENLWIELNTLLIYKSRTFMFNSHVIITELDGTLIKMVSKKSLYENDGNGVELYGNAKKLRSDQHSVIILSNQISTGASAYDAIKLKLSAFLNATHLPVLAVFALRPNCFAKPHTKMWTVYVKTLYRDHGAKVVESIVVSSRGGFAREIFDKKEEKVVLKRQTDDVDIAFAHNIESQFIAIDTFLNPSSVPKVTQWNSHIIAPELRKDYILSTNMNMETAHQKNKLTGPSGNDFFYDSFATQKIDEIILKGWKQLPKSDTLVILVFGAPTSGKSTLIKELNKRVAVSNWGKHNTLKYLDLASMSSRSMVRAADKYLAQRFNLMIEGVFPNEISRAPFIALAQKHNSSILLIEVNPGIEICKLFNHLRVETVTDLTELVALSKYYDYRGRYIHPAPIKNCVYVLYRPIVVMNNILQKYRF